MKMPQFWDFKDYDLVHEDLLAQILERDDLQQVTRAKIEAVVSQRLKQEETERATSADIIGGVDVIFGTDQEISKERGLLGSQAFVGTSQDRKLESHFNGHCTVVESFPGAESKDGNNQYSYKIYVATERVYARPDIKAYIQERLFELGHGYQYNFTTKHIVRRVMTAEAAEILGLHDLGYPDSELQNTLFGGALESPDTIIENE